MPRFWLHVWQQPMHQRERCGSDSALRTMRRWESGSPIATAAPNEMAKPMETTIATQSGYIQDATTCIQG